MLPVRQCSAYSCASGVFLQIYVVRWRRIGGIPNLRFAVERWGLANGLHPFW